MRLVGRELDELRADLARFAIVEDHGDPEVVIAFGGDGTLVGAEREFPGVPKVPIRSSRSCRKCPEHAAAAVYERLLRRELSRRDLVKVEVLSSGRRKLAMNEVGIHMLNPASAVRFRVTVNGRPYIEDEVIGDGAMLASPFGSTAYFRSVTRGTFRIGLGFCIINSVDPVGWAVLRETDRVRIEITRGPAVVLADNDPERWELSAGDSVEIGAASERAVILGFDALVCQKCELIPRRPPR